MVHNFRVLKAYCKESQKVLKRLDQGQLILTSEGRTRVPKSLPNPNTMYDKSPVETL